MERHWFLTWTTYGTWLPGDDRGFVCNVSSPDGMGQRLNEFGSEPASTSWQNQLATGRAW